MIRHFRTVQPVDFAHDSEKEVDLSLFLRLSAAELAEMSDAAMRLDLPDHGQRILDAAYDVGDGFPCGEIQDVLADVRQVALTAGRDVLLSPHQKLLLRIATAVLPLALLCASQLRPAPSRVPIVQAPWAGWPVN